MYNFDTIILSNMEIKFTCKADNEPGYIDPLGCGRFFEKLSWVEDLQLRSITIRDKKVLHEARLLSPLRKLKKLVFEVSYEPDDGRDSVVPMEMFAYLPGLEELHLRMHGAIEGVSRDPETTVPLPVSKSLKRLTIACRQCNEAYMEGLGKTVRSPCIDIHSPNLL